MKAYLVRQGVATSQIIMDREGNSTFATAVNLKQMMVRYSLSHVTLVTQHFHMARTKFIMRRLGIDHVQAATADTVSLRSLKSLLRELLAFDVYVVQWVLLCCRR